MLFTIVIVLILVLVIAAVVIGAAQQHKEKQEIERRGQLAKYKAIIEETEEVLMNSSNVPMSSDLTTVLHKRIHEALKAMQELSPNAKEVRTRLVQSKERIDNADPNASGKATKLSIPDNDGQTINIVQGIKKLRIVLRSEHSKGNIDSQVFMAEDRTLASMQLQINVESQIRRGKKAKAANMLGSARQYFEKALSTLEGQSYTDEFITNKTKDVEEYIEEITSELKNVNAKDAKEKEKESIDELDILFAPKKKW